MAGNVAADIDRDGQSRDMGRGKFDGGAQRGRLAAEALRAYIEGICLFEYLRFHRGVILIGIRLADRAAESLLASSAHCSKSPPIPTPITIGGQGLLPARRTTSTT